MEAGAVVGSSAAHTSMGWVNGVIDGAGCEWRWSPVGGPSEDDATALLAVVTGVAARDDGGTVLDDEG